MRVLVDASSVVVADQLLKGRRPPSALSLFDLARLTEALVIHDKVIVLDTSPAGSGAEREIRRACSAVPGAVLEVKKASALEIITKYVDLSRPGFAARMSAGSEYLQRVANDRDFDPVVRRIKRLLLSADSYEMEDYVALLSELWTASKNERRDHGQKGRGLRHRLRASFGGKRSAQQLDLVPAEDRGAVFSAYCDVYRRCDPSGGSAFAMWRVTAGRDYQSFAQSMFSRANLYILAGELYRAPYRPGALRWPICWRHFTTRSLPETSSTAEALVRLAERLEVQQLDRIKELFNNGSVTVKLPLLLRYVLSRSDNRRNILREAMALRWSPEATRFRALAARLDRNVEDERFDLVIKDLSECSRTLASAYGLDDANTNFTLLSAPCLSLQPGTAVSESVSLPVTGGTVLDLGQAIARWWRTRRFGLITGAVRSVAAARDLSKDVERLFSQALTEDDFALLSRLETFGGKDVRAPASSNVETH